MLNIVYVSLILSIIPQKKMPFGQQIFITYLSGILGLAGRTGLKKIKKSVSNWKLKQQLQNNKFWIILRHQLYKCIKLMMTENSTYSW